MGSILVALEGRVQDLIPEKAAEDERQEELDSEEEGRADSQVGQKGEEEGGKQGNGMEAALLKEVGSNRRVLQGQG